MSTELTLWDLLGGRMSFDTALYLRVLTHQRTLLFVFLALLTFVAADPSASRSYVPLWFSIIIWPIAFSFYLIVYNAQFLLFAALTRRFNWLSVPTPLVGFVALLPTVVVCKNAVIYMSDGEFPYDVTDQLIFYFLSVQGLETVFYRFILPGVRTEIEAAKPSRLLVIGGEQIDLAQLLHIEAREHHVHLTFENAKSRARARLGDIVAQTSAEDGMQPHRSWWVARDPAIRTERRNGRLILRLRDDTEVPVARTRVEDVLDWLDNHVHPGQ
ncbi:MAG: LytTR family DNA-binding domain-containing protein [Pelagibaca sp.]